MAESKIRKDAMVTNQTSYEKMATWPYLPWIIFLSSLMILIFIWCLALLVNAPLEEAAAWAVTPKIAKAPWYFVGLQELLAYFDPWMAGVMIPGALMGGLILIPYVDTAPDVQGCYNFKDRKFQVGFFVFGAIFWFVLIFVGQVLRGPSWEFYWPYIDYPIGGDSWVYPGHHLKTSHAQLKSLGIGGIIGTIAFFGAGMTLPAVLFKDYTKKLGPIKYVLVWIHVTATAGVVVKIILRLVFSIKYVVVTPWFSI